MSEDGDGVLENCECKENCRSCGYGEMARGEEDRCLSCENGYTFEMLFTDKTGTCTEGNLLFGGARRATSKKRGLLGIGIVGMGMVFGGAL